MPHFFYSYFQNGATKLFTVIFVLLIDFPVCLFLGFDKIARMLIEKGANVNAADDNNLSVLMYAALNGETIAYFFMEFSCNIQQNLTCRQNEGQISKK